ncbi:MAG: MoaD/ThiS family protein [Bacteroidetes bacterium]|nr:MoaD/ThiS family protein [Bacteroidota bacterium]
MKISVKYFAALREQASISEEIIDTVYSKPGDIYAELKLKYNFSLNIDELKVAVNDCYEDFGYELKEMDTIVFIPPVAGG